ncbi:MAG: hypothetical protein JZU47_12390 [Prolixibacteraceae bacterium]|nr:hypothetical protein [Prolixibacteraceae bacterium]
MNNLRIEPLFKKSVLMCLFLLSQINYSFSQLPLWQGKGRIVISSDGNEHDHDDWAATPLSLAIIAAKGLQNKLTVYIYSDHIWGSNYEHPGVDGVKPYDQMKESAINGGRMFWFKQTKFICAVDNPEIAYEALQMEIDKSDSENPLFIIAAGPVQVIGESISKANKDKRKFVTVISTINCWNDTHADNPYPWENHSGWTMAEIIQHFSNPEGGDLKVISIQNQNPCLMRNWKEYEWLMTAPERNNEYYRNGSWAWLFNRICMSIKPVSGVENYYAVDPSDAGKVVYLFTGIENTSPQLCYEIMRKPPLKASMNK